MALFPCLHIARFRFTLIRVRIGKKQSKLFYIKQLRQRMNARYDSWGQQAV